MIGLNLRELTDSLQQPFVSFSFYEEYCDAIHLRTNFKGSDGFAITGTGADIILRVSLPERVPYGIEILCASNRIGELIEPRATPSASVPAIWGEETDSDVEITFDPQNKLAKAQLKLTPVESYQRFGNSLVLGLDQDKDIAEIWMTQILDERGIEAIESEHNL